MPFTFKKLSIPDVILVEPGVFPDSRGSFSEIFKSTDFKANGINADILQLNVSRSHKHVLRGLHYQLEPKSQAKLVSVTRGEIFAVAVDIRKGSPFFGKWVEEHLSGTNRRMIYLPEGFANGFYALSDDVECLYHCSNEYDPALERTIIWNDPLLAIPWPTMAPVLSPKDAGGASFEEAENNFTYKRP